MSKRVSLSEGSGGKEMQALVREFRKRLPKGNWKNVLDDAASIDFKGKLVFTTDSYVVTPLFFPGGDIGKIAFCGTVNDLAVMGAKPLGVSVSMIIEEGFSKKKLFKIIDSIARESKKTGVPVVTGDTKVMEKGSVDKLIINTSGVGKAEKILDEKLSAGDTVIVSGGIGEHAAALLAERFELKSKLKTDCKPIWEEINSVRKYLRQAKDITRGGLSGVLNELAGKNSVQIFVEEEKIPVKREVRSLTEILGIDFYPLACEGRFVCVCSAKNSVLVLKKLKKFNSSAVMIGTVRKGSDVIVQTKFGKKKLKAPSGKIVPRIC